VQFLVTIFSRPQNYLHCCKVGGLQNQDANGAVIRYRKPLATRDLEPSVFCNDRVYKYPNVNLRLKGASIYWFEETAEAMLLLRSFYTSGRWAMLNSMHIQ
jgi:hypothetical protein